MAADDGETPMVVDEPTAEGGDTADVSKIVAFYSEPVDATPTAEVAAEGAPEPSKSNPTTPNGKGNPVNHSNKKQKHDNSSAGGDGRKEREEWTESEVAILLDTYLERYIELNRSILRGQDWKVVAELVAGAAEKNSSKSVEQCKNKIDNLKKRYKTEIQRMEKTGVSTSRWNWFKKLQAIVGDVPPTPKSISDDDTRSAGGNSNLSLRRSARLTYGNSPTANNMKSKSAHSPKWRRVIFKVSGTALAGTHESIDPKVALQLADEVAKASRQGVEVAIVLGGRNFFCGDSWVSSTDLDRPTAYQIGMMATVMNSVLLQSALEKLGIQTRVQSAFAIPEVAEPYNRLRAMRHLEKGRVVIFGGIGAGTGNPLFTTDTGAALRATEINADAVLKGTNINGIYDSRSRHRNATKRHISFSEVVIKDVTAMDAMAIQYCEENGIPVVIFNLLELGNVSKALCGEQVGTLIDQDGPTS